MTLETFTLCLNAIMNFCWEILSKPIILGTYSLWNVFTGIFAVWAFRFVFVDNIFQKDSGSVTHAKKGNHYNRAGQNRKDKD